MDRRTKLILIIFLSIFAQNTFAAAITVNSDIDDAASVGSVPNRCTLREAIIASNSTRPEITITDSTFVYNTANTDNNQGGVLGGNGGGISGEAVSIKNTLIALNEDLDSSHPDLDSAVTSLGFNRVGIAAAFTGQPSDKWGTATSPFTLKVFPLANNGGVGKSHLSNDSAILDAGNCAAQIDQNGVKRPIDDPNVGNPSGGNGCDIGATEFKRR